jgi:hypothetical protein
MAGPEFLETELRARLLHMRYILPQPGPDSQDSAVDSNLPRKDPPAAATDLLAACRTSTVQVVFITSFAPHHIFSSFVWSFSIMS